jgi:hypothetical protein
MLTMYKMHHPKADIHRLDWYNKKQHMTVKRRRWRWQLLLLPPQPLPPLLLDVAIPGDRNLIDVAIPGARNVIQKEAEEISKYKDLTIEI